jgi:hypothetical protein
VANGSDVRCDRNLPLFCGGLSFLSVTIHRCVEALDAEAAKSQPTRCGLPCTRAARFEACIRRLRGALNARTRLGDARAVRDVLGAAAACAAAAEPARAPRVEAVLKRGRPDAVYELAAASGVEVPRVPIARRHPHLTLTPGR